MNKRGGAGAGALIVVIALSLTGCGSNSSGSSADTNPGSKSTSSGSSDPAVSTSSATNPMNRHACKLISPREASRADGVKYLSSGEFNLGSLCNFKAPGDGSDDFSLLLGKGVSATDWKLQLSMMSSDNGAASTQTISGVGDRSAAAGQSFAFESHGFIVEVKNADYRNGTGKPGDWTRSTALAKTIVAKMS